MRNQFIEFFADKPGRNLPRVRVTLCTEDTKKIVEVLAENGNTEATILQNAYKLAHSIADFAKKSN